MFFISSSFYDYEIEDENIRALMEKPGVGDHPVRSGGPDVSAPAKTTLERSPLCFLGDNIPEGMVSQITVNNYEGTRMATRYLISLGHRELMFSGAGGISL